MNKVEANQLALDLLPGTFNIHRLPATHSIPPAVLSAPLMSVLRSESELSIVCDSQIAINSAEQIGPWRAFRVAGTLDFALVGILSKLTTVLAAAGISVFAISSYDTDYLLVREESVAATSHALIQAGYLFNNA